MNYLSDTNLRAVLHVLISQAGGTIEITNEALYDAMLPDSGWGEHFRVTETETGVRLTIEPDPPRRSAAE
jgi:hypothetical protein